MMQRPHFPAVDKRLAVLMAMTPALTAAGWRPIESVPHDGSEIEIRIVHVLAAYSSDPHADGYIATAKAQWIDFNGGGLTWHGLCGTPCQWRPLGNVNSSIPAGGTPGTSMEI